MIRKARRSGGIYAALFAGVAVALPLFCYATGFRAVGGALLLSSLLVFTLAVIRSGALATSWLTQQTRLTLENATRYELAKAMICAGLAVDALSGGIHVLRRFVLYDYFSMTIVLTAAGLLGVAAGLYLTRWFAGYLVTLR